MSAHDDPDDLEQTRGASTTPPRLGPQSAAAEMERSPRANRFAALPLLAWVTAAGVVGLLMYLLLSPGPRDVADASASGAPAASPAGPSSSAIDPAPVGIGSVTLEYRDPPGWEARMQVEHRVVGFDDAADNQPGPLSYGWIGQQIDREAHGVVVADLTDVDFHTNDPPPHARTAAEFFDNMQALNMGTVSSPSYAFGPVEETELAGWPALTAPVEANTAYAVFEGGPDGHLALALNRRQQLIVADVGNSIVLVQIWANSAEGLTAWLPRAEELLATLILTPGD